MNVVFGGCVVCLYKLCEMNVHERPQNSTVNYRLQALSLYIFIRGLRGLIIAGAVAGGGGGAYNRNQLGGLISRGGLKSGSLR